MRKLLFLTGIRSLGCSAFSGYVQNACDRKCRVALMDRHIAALAQHDARSVPIANDFKFLENTEKSAIGRGLWETAVVGPAKFKIYAADPIAGQVGFMGVLQEKTGRSFSVPAVRGSTAKSPRSITWWFAISRNPCRPI